MSRTFSRTVVVPIVEGRGQKIGLLAFGYRSDGVATFTRELGEPSPDLELKLRDDLATFLDDRCTCQIGTTCEWHSQYFERTRR